MKSRILSLVMAFILAASFFSGITISVYAADVPKADVDKVFTDRWAVIPQIQAPVIDGKLDDEIWSSAARLKDFVTLYHNQPAPQATETKLGYDSSNLYIGIVCFPRDGQEPGKEFFEQLDIIISPKTTSIPYYQIPIQLSNRSNEREDGLYFTSVWGAEENERILFGQNAYNVVKTKNDAGDWIIEIAIPFSSFGKSSVNEGEEWRFNVIRYREGNTPVSSWNPVRYSHYSDQGQYFENTRLRNYSIRYYSAVEGRAGSIFFKNASFPNGSQSGTSVIKPWDIGNVKLQYITYTDKKISFDAGGVNVAQSNFDMYWRYPSGRFDRITDKQVVKDGDRVSVTFHNPKPFERGMYQLHMLLKDNGGTGSMLSIVSFDDQGMYDAGDTLYVPPVNTQKTTVAYAPVSATVQNLLNLMPQNMGFRFIGRPDRPELNPDSLYTWSINSPYTLTTVKQGDESETYTITRSNDFANDKTYLFKNSKGETLAAYPEDKVLKVKNPRGETIEYPYYEDENGKRYFITANIWFRLKENIISQTGTISNSDPVGAARLLYKWSQISTGLVFVNDYPWCNYPIEAEAGPPHPFWGGKWARWGMEELYRMMGLLNAFDNIRKTNAFELLSQEVEEDVEKKVNNDILKPAVEFITQLQVLNHNIEYRNWQGLIKLGRIFNDPKYIHYAESLLDYYFKTQYYADGFWKEISISYHNQSTTGITTGVTELMGWTDPVGYISPRTGKNFVNLDKLKELPALGKSQVLPDYLTYPNKRVLPIQDTWATDNRPAAVLDSGSFLLPSTGLAKLTRGLGPEQVQMYLTYVAKHAPAHTHKDPLNLVLYSNQQELIPDIGYTHTSYRSWTASTLAHNTVVANSQDIQMTGKGRDAGSVELFAPVSDSLQVIRARQEYAYPGVRTYMREPWFIGFNGAQGNAGYVLDIFRVEGGSRHEYTLNGDIMNDAYFESSLPLLNYGAYLLPEGTEVTMPVSETDVGKAISPDGELYHGYIYVRDVKSADVREGNYDLNLVTKQGTTDMARMKITGIVDPGQNQLFVGKAFSVKGTRINTNNDKDNELTSSYFMPKYVLRREGEDLKSTFITAIEPYSAATSPVIEKVEKLTPDIANDGDAVVKVSYGNTTDIIISSSLYPEKPLVIGDITLEGKMGFIRLENGKVKNMYLIGGTLLKYGEMEIIDKGPETGNIVNILRKANGDDYDAFIIDNRIAPYTQLRNIVVNHPDGTTTAYPIDEIVRKDNQTHVKLYDCDPIFEVNSDGSSEMMFFPMKKWTGAHTFSIDNITEYVSSAPKFVDQHGGDISVLPASGFIYARVEVENESDKDMPVKLIVVLKNDKNAAVKIRFIENTAKAGETSIFNVGFTLPDNSDGYYAEAYVWDSIEGMRPLTKAVRILK